MCLYQRQDFFTPMLNCKIIQWKMPKPILPDPVFRGEKQSKCSIASTMNASLLFENKISIY